MLLRSCRVRGVGERRSGWWSSWMVSIYRLCSLQQSTTDAAVVGGMCQPNKGERSTFGEMDPSDLGETFLTAGPLSNQWWPLRCSSPFPRYRGPAYQQKMVSFHVRHGAFYFLVFFSGQICCLNTLRKVDRRRNDFSIWTSMTLIYLNYDIVRGCRNTF